MQSYKKSELFPNLNNIYFLCNPKREYLIFTILQMSVFREKLTALCYLADDYFFTFGVTINRRPCFAILKEVSPPYYRTSFKY